MFSLMGSLLKWTVFAAAVLILSHTLQWEGKTVSDQVRTSLAKTRSADWYQRAQNVAEEFVSGKPMKNSTSSLEIQPNEREKLKNLLKEIR